MGRLLKLSMLLLVLLCVPLTTANAEYEDINIYHTVPNVIPIGQYMFLGKHTDTYLYMGEINETYQVFIGLDAKGNPMYRTVRRVGSLFSKNGTIRLAQGTAVQFLEEKMGYLGAAEEKTYFWRVRDVITNKEYWLHKFNVKMERSDEVKAMMGGYRLNLTYYTDGMYAKEQTTGYVGSANGSFAGFKSVTVPQYSRFIYGGIQKIGNEYYVKSMSQTEDRVLEIRADKLEGGLPPVFVDKPILDNNNNDNKPDEVVEYATIEFGQSVIPKSNFATVYAKKGTKELTSPTSIVTGRAYTFYKKYTVGGKEVMQLKEATGSKSVYLYSDGVAKGSFDVITGDVKNKSYEIEYAGEVATKNKKTYYYTSATSSKVSGMQSTESGKKFVVTGSKIVGSKTYMQGTLYLTSSKYESNVYILPTALTKANVSITYRNNMVLPMLYAKLPSGIKGYNSVKLVKNAIQYGTKTTVTRSDVVYTIKSTKTVGSKTFVGVSSDLEKVIYYIELDGKQITLQQTK